jgi:hypothetical protein
MSEVEKLRGLLQDCRPIVCEAGYYQLAARLDAVLAEPQGEPAIYPAVETWPAWAQWCGLDPSGYWVFYERKPVTSEHGRTPNGGSWGQPQPGEPQPNWTVMIYPRTADEQAEPAPAQCCKPTEAELKLLNDGDYTPEELWGGREPSCPKCFKPAPAQDERTVDTAPLVRFIFSEYGSPEMAGRLPDDVVRVVRALEAGDRPAQTEQQPIELPEGYVLVPEDQIIEVDDYGIPGSTFHYCKLCQSESGAGMQNHGIPHKPGCAMLAALSAQRGDA